MILMRIFLRGAQEVIVNDDMGTMDMQAAQAAQVEINLLRVVHPGTIILELFFEFIAVRY
jgi:hypothetical protein